MTQDKTKTSSDQGSFDQLIDNIWQSMKSMKFAIILLVLLTIASVFNLFANEFIIQVKGDSAQKFSSFQSRYGEIRATLIMVFQMHDPYRSWWYIALLGLITLSLSICVIDRTSNIYKKIFSPRFRSNPDLYSRMEPRAKLKGGNGVEEAILQSLHSRRYKFWQKSEDGFRLIVGVRNRWSFLGSWLVHVGFLLLIVGGVMIARGEHRENAGGMPGELLAENEDKWGFNVRVDDFTIEYNPLAVDQLVEVDNRMLGQITSRDSDSTFHIKIYRPRSDMLHEVGVSRISNRIDNFASEGSRFDASNISDYIAMLTVIEKGEEVLTKRVEVNAPLRYGGYRFYQSSYNDRRTDSQGRWTTILDVRKDRGSPFVWAGILFFSIGSILGMYLIPRQIFARITSEGDKKSVLMAGKTGRHFSIFQEEFSEIVKRIRKSSG